MIRKIFPCLMFFIFLPIIIFSAPVFAADTNIDCGATPGTCSVTGIDPLFSSTDGFWFPGRILSKTINLKNSSDSTQTMSLRADRSPLSLIIPSSLEDDNIINISLVNSIPSLLWSGDLDDFYSAGEIDFGIFASGINADYSLIVSMNTAADNNYQDKEAKFDLTLGFTADTPPSPPVTDGGVGGVSPPVCNDAVPGTPTNLSVSSISSTQALLAWDHVSAPFTSYLIAFGPSIGNYLWGNPNVGSGNSYTVGSLTPGAQYCFYVRAQNGCMPGLASTPVCINPGSPIPIIEPFPPGFVEGVSDEQTTPTPYQPGTTEGQTTCLRFWLPLLWLLALIINTIHYHNQIDQNPARRSRFRHLFAFLVALVAFLIDYFLLQTRCCLITPLYCRYFWIGNIFALLLPLYYYRKLKQ